MLQLSDASMCALHAPVVVLSGSTFRAVLLSHWSDCFSFCDGKMEQLPSLSLPNPFVVLVGFYFFILLCSLVSVPLSWLSARQHFSEAFGRAKGGRSLN